MVFEAIRAKERYAHISKFFIQRPTIVFRTHAKITEQSLVVFRTRKLLNPPTADNN
jgi:hypothetical protein